MLLSMSATEMSQSERQATRADASDDIREAQAGSTRAYERLYRAHVGQVYALCLRMTANAARAEDATQDAFIQAWRKLDRFRGESAFSSWLHRIAVNAVLMQMRQHKREAAGLQAVRDQMAVDEDAHSPVSAQSAPDLEKAIAALPERARQVFVLAGVYGYTHEQVAETLDVAVGTCKAHLHRARSLLKEYLEQ